MGCSSLVDPGRATTAVAWIHPLSTTPAPETGASSLESDFILDICKTDSKCQAGPTAPPGDVSSQPDSLTRQPSRPAAAPGRPDPPTLSEAGCPLPFSLDPRPCLLTVQWKNAAISFQGLKPERVTPG